MMNFARTAVLVSPLVLAALVGACDVDEAGDPASASTDPDASTAPKTCPAKDGTTGSAGPTVHEGDLAGDEVWTAEGSPHVVNADVAVRDGKKLTIAPCAVVQLASGASLDVAFPLTPNQGELVAVGTAEEPIRFEGKSDARWNHVFVHAPGTARLAYVTFEDGGGGETAGHETIGAMGDGELPRKAILFVDHVTVRGSRGAGIRLDRGAAFMPGSTELVIEGSGANDEAHPYPLEVGESAIDGIPSGRYTGNGKDEIVLLPEVMSAAGGFQEETTMHDRGVPYHVGDTAGHDDLEVGNGTRNTVLTIEPGVTLRFEKQNGVRVETAPSGASAIRAMGTEAKPVVFTSASPDPQPGDWRGFYFNGEVSAQNALDHVRIEYTGHDCACSLVSCSDVSEFEAAIILPAEPKSVFLTNSVVAHAAGHGVVQGYTGSSFDWKASNTFDDVAGCPVTEPWHETVECLDPKPSCK